MGKQGNGRKEENNTKLGLLREYLNAIREKGVREREISARMGLTKKQGAKKHKENHRSLHDKPTVPPSSNDSFIYESFFFQKFFLPIEIIFSTVFFARFVSVYLLWIDQSREEGKKNICSD